jgi:dihydroxy-acid dehydratase
MELNKYSKTITLDTTQPAAQAMFYGIGLTDEDLQKAQVGVSAWVMMVTPVICT